ncbi:MAG TPA: purine-nucleoside phosphorylase [Pirellulaceae bacterium]|nr:purine-nucleoside phosphorylase [Pirellulaceae bacterium]
MDLGPALAAIRRHWKGQAATGVILGTGLGEIAEEVAADAIIPYREIPGFPYSTAMAHKGRLVCGLLNGTPVVMLQGRCHLYEGYSLAAVTFPTRVLHALGIQTLIVTNAAGGINPQYAVGDVMLIDDHINLMWLPSVGQASSLPKIRHIAAANLYDDELAHLSLAIARRANFLLHRGVYVAVTGPSYETRAEYRAFRRIGGDCVGMSTVPEVLTAASLGLRVLGLSTITNVARPDAPQTVSAEEVVHVAASALPKVRAIIHGMLNHMHQTGANSLRNPAASVPPAVANSD